MERISHLLKEYEIYEVCGDKFGGDMAMHKFFSNGIEYKAIGATKSTLYLSAEAAFNAERVEIPPRELLISQFKSLVRKAHSGGRESVDTATGIPEDEANVVAGVIYLLSKKAEEPKLEIFWL